MRRTLTTLAAALTLTTTAACGGSDEPQWPEHEQAYLEALHEDAREAGSGIMGLGDEWVIDLGYAVCDDLEGGMAPTEVVQSLEKPEEDETPVSKVASPVVGHAEVYLCD